MEAVAELSATVGVRVACGVLGVPAASFYRNRPHPPDSVPVPVVPAVRRPSRRALSAEDRAAILETIHQERFQDRSPAEIHATLMDGGIFLCSLSTMHRLLRRRGESGERRSHRIHPAYKKPELLATGPNQLWSWDITKLRGPEKWTYYHLYVILDVFSRYVVGWMVMPREGADLAKVFIAETIEKYAIPQGQLTIHADRGKVMRSKPVAFLMAELGVTKTHSRPHVSNDNPYSESQFRTLKYMPEFSDRFGSIEHARQFCHTFFPWYNDEHHHSGLAMLTPVSVHFGQATQVLAARQTVLDAAYREHPERFVRHPPKVAPVPNQVWINKPTADQADSQ